MVAKCSRCGASLSPKHKFCPNCGQPIYAAPSATQGVSKVGEASTPPSTSLSSQLAPSSRLGAAFWLGLVGAIFGLLIGAVLLAISTLSFVTATGEAWARIIGLIVFSILGLVGPLRIIEKQDTINAGLMFVAGVGMLICVYQLVILSALLFFIGGALLLLKKG